MAWRYLTHLDIIFEMVTYAVYLLGISHVIYYMMCSKVKETTIVRSPLSPLHLFLIVVFGTQYVLLSQLTIAM